MNMGGLNMKNVTNSILESTSYPNVHIYIVFNTRESDTRPVQTYQVNYTKIRLRTLLL